MDILKGLKSRFEEHHNVKYALAALQAAAELSAKYINDRHLPDKAIDVIDEAGAAQRILPASKRKKTISKTEVEEIVAKIARIPPANVSNDDRGKLQTLERDLKSVVFGQDKALEVLAASVKMARSGLGKSDKPIGAFLFSGPTGVGKTEAAKQLAYIMGIDLLRFDMSEYMERHAVSRLIGAPPGYVGFDQGGLLTEAITKKPHCVLLLDEIEKAHPDIFNVLLQVMDHGTLTDNNGRKADFRNVIIIMTTNAGAETMNKGHHRLHQPARGGRRDGRHQAPVHARVPQPGWTPMVSFKALDENIIMRVVDKFLLQLEGQLAEKKVEVTFTDTLRKHLAKKGFDPLMGARPMQRLIQDTIRRALADELLFGRLTEGGRLTVDLETKVGDDGKETRRSSWTSSRCPRRKARPSLKKPRRVEAGAPRAPLVQQKGPALLGLFAVSAEWRRGSQERKAKMAWAQRAASLASPDGAGVDAVVEVAGSDAGRLVDHGDATAGGNPVNLRVQRSGAGRIGGVRDDLWPAGCARRACRPGCCRSVRPGPGPRCLRPDPGTGRWCPGGSARCRGPRWTPSPQPVRRPRRGAPAPVAFVVLVEVAVWGRCRRIPRSGCATKLTWQPAPSRLFQRSRR